MIDPNNPEVANQKQPIAGGIPNPNEPTAGAKPAAPVTQNAQHFGLSDDHFGAPNENGVRPVNQSGIDQLKKSVQSSMKLPKISIGSSDMPQIEGIPQLRKGLLGRAFDQAKSSVIGNLTDPLTSGVSKSMNSGLDTIGNMFSTSADDQNYQSL